MNIVLLSALLAGLASACAVAQTGSAPPCAASDKRCATAAMRDHPATRLDAWATTMAVPAAERIGPAPPGLIDYINLDNIANGYPANTRAIAPEATLVADVREAISDLPPRLWALFGKRLAGLHFVERLGGTGFTGYVRDADGKPAAAFVVLDAAVLAGQRANAWATWKENTPFAAGGPYRLEARIEEDSGDNRRNAIQYILLHELGHVLSVGGDLHPPWNISPKEVATVERYPFFRLSWRIDRKADLYRSLFDARFPQRARTVYYFGARLPAGAMQATYANLKKTNFPSLYAATSPGDDFAEAFAGYVHTVLLKRPWQITIRQGDRVVDVIGACWNEPRCASKRAILEQLLGNAL